jgi:hypothetical protein
MMRENAEEDIDDAKLPAAQWRPVGVTEIRAFDEFATQHAAGRDIAFNDVHAKLRTWLIRPIAAVAHHTITLTRPQAPQPQASAEVGTRHDQGVGDLLGVQRALRQYSRAWICATVMPQCAPNSPQCRTSFR